MSRPVEPNYRPIEPTYRSTIQRSAMQQALLHDKRRAEQPYLFHAGRVPWYAALQAGGAGGA